MTASPHPTSVTGPSVAIDAGGNPQFPPRVRLVDASPANAPDLATLADKAVMLLDDTPTSDSAILNILCVNGFTSAQIADIWPLLKLRLALRDRGRG